MNWLINVIRHWVPLAVAVTALAGLVGLTVQQSYRMSANDPQIQMAENAGNALANGAAPESLLPAAIIDIATSLTPYLVVYDDTGKAVAASGLLDNRMPSLPSGVFDYTRQHGEDRISWQPAPGVRSAAVVVHYSGEHPGFVMAGRSLREVERREDQLTAIVAAAWMVTLVATLLTVVVLEFIFGRPARSRTA